MSKSTTYRRKNQLKNHGHHYHNAEGQKALAQPASSREQYEQMRAREINALRASRGLAALEAAEAIAWERNMRLGVAR